MLYRNFEIHNVAQIVNNDDGSISWVRLPQAVYDNLDGQQGRNMALNSTGVELRFVLKSGEAKIKMSTLFGEGVFHVYRGSIQGGWEDHEEQKTVRDNVSEYVIKKSKNIAKLSEITQKCSYPFEPEVIRILFDRGIFKIYDVIGDIAPPEPAQVPKKTLLAYGSSITHGSNSIDISHSWVSVVAHNLRIDARNLGMAGSCRMEPAFVDYIASEGEKSKWDIATLELGINSLDFDDAKILARTENTILQVAGRNIDKPVFVISPFYHCSDDFKPDDRAKVWRKFIPQIIRKLDLPNVTYINGFDILNSFSYMSADEVHPNIYGVQRIADKLTQIISHKLSECK